MDVTDLVSAKIDNFSPITAIARSLRSILLLYLILPMNVVTLWWAYDGQLRLDAASLCRRSMRVGGRQQGTCRHEFEIVHQVALGIDLALDECRLQFEDRHWNCNTTWKYSVVRLFKLDTREAAYVQAIIGAGVLHAVAEACSRGQLLACSCDNSVAYGRGGSHNVRSQVTTKAGGGGGGVGGYRLTDEQSTAVLAGGDFMWGGCTDDVGFAYEETKKFIDVEHSSNRATDFRTMIISHNQEAGRLASKSHMRTKCKCHGLSGSCTTKTCWKRVEEFVRVGDRLRVSFDAALQVTVSNVDGNKLVVASSLPPSPPLYAGRHHTGGGRPRPLTPLASSYPESLVYSHNSPDYCRRNRKLGIVGTRGRRCSASAAGGAVGSCGALCCGRGSRASCVTVQQNCNCKFRWCCEVVCQTCFVNETIHTCK